MRRILHIGLGKTGTTTFQQSVLPSLERHGSVASNLQWSREQGRAVELAMYNTHVERPRIIWPSSKGVVLLTYEGLVGTPQRWKHNFESLSSMLDKDVEILISFRDPLDWLISNYLQALSMGLIVAPEEFFVHSESPRGIRDGAREIPQTFAPDLVDFESLVRHYASYFHDVRAVPMKAMLTVDEFCKALDLQVPDSTRSDFSSEPSSRRFNVSYSKQAVQLTFRREQLLAKLGLRSRNYVDKLGEQIDKIICPQISIDDNVRQYANCPVQPGSIRRAGSRLATKAAELGRWRWWMQAALPRLVRVEPFEWDYDFLSNFPTIGKSRHFVGGLGNGTLFRVKGGNAGESEATNI